MSGVVRFLAGQAVLVALVVALPWLVLGVYPGALGATAPILCPEAQPDPHVVEHHTDTGDGVGTSWTLVCQGPRGDVTEVGTWAPLGVVFGATLVAAELLVLPLQAWGALRRRRRGPGGSAAGAPVRRIAFGAGGSLSP